MRSYSWNTRRIHHNLWSRSDKYLKACFVTESVSEFFGVAMILYRMIVRFHTNMVLPKRGEKKKRTQSFSFSQNWSFLTKSDITLAGHFFGNSFWAHPANASPPPTARTPAAIVPAVVVAAPTAIIAPTVVTIAATPVSFSPDDCC